METPKITITKACPTCGSPMVERTNRQNGSTFLGCSRYPECEATAPIPESVKLRRAGQRDMFEDGEERAL